MAFLEIGGAGFSLMPQGFPTNAHLHCSGADALVRGRPPGGPVELWKCLTLRTSSGTRASRADQGVRPTILCRIPYLGNPCGIRLKPAPRKLAGFSIKEARKNNFAPSVSALRDAGCRSPRGSR